MEYESRTRVSSNSIDLERDALWPLEVGNEKRFGAQVSYLNKETGIQSRYDRIWDCEVDGTEKLSVYAGTFETYRITCESYSVKGKLRQRRVWHYAPEIEHLVSRWDDYAGKRISYLELTAYQPYVIAMSSKWKRSYWKRLRRVMENNPAGRSLTWRDKTTGTRVTITPVSTMKSANGIFCRNFRMNITSQGGERSGAGLVCRDEKGYWKIPRSIKSDEGVKL